MVNRTMQAKNLKRLRQLRGLPRQYHSNYIPVGRNPNQEVINGYKERAKGLAFDEEFLESIFPTRYKGVAPGRVEVIKHIRRIQETAPALMCFTILDTRIHRARVFFNAEKTAFILSYENYKEGVVRTSMTYQFRDNLIDDFRKQKMLWVEFGACTAPPPRNPAGRF